MDLIKLAIHVLSALPFLATAALAQKTEISLATATPGGGFPLFGDTAAAVINETDPTLNVVTRNTKGSEENIVLLETGKFDIGLVAGVPAYEAFAGIGRARTNLKIIAAIYSSPGMFVVRSDSPVRSVRDLVGKPVAWGVPSSGLTLMGRYIMDGLGLDRDKDFAARFLDNAGDGAGMVLNGEVAALWGAGLGWPNFTKVMKAGGRFIGFTAEEVAKVGAKHAFLKPMTLAAGSYEGQTEPVGTLGVWSYILSRPDLPDGTAYRLAKALQNGHAALAGRLPQAQETIAENTKAAAPDPALIHPGVQKFLRELGL
jgi:TRAP transporter TAXI family solute receptor